MSLVCALAAPSCHAAELRIGFGELATIARQVLSDAKIRLHNVPGGFIDFSAGSSITIGSSQTAIPIPVRAFDAAGARYAYYVNEINSTSVAVEAIDGALRLTLSFEADAPELVGRCLSGLCPPNAALPTIEWSNPSLSIELAPVGVEGSLSLEAKRVRIGGELRPLCSSTAGFISKNLCQAVLPKSRQTITRLRADLDEVLRRQVSTPEVKGKIANALKSKLVFGPAGAVHVTRVVVDSQSVTVAFCLVC